jgi:predicted nucleotidyltransferase
MTHFTDAAADALFGRSRRAILALLFGQPGQAFYLRQIAQLTGLAVGSVQRELANLLRADLVDRRAEGSQVYFRANAQSPIYAELVGLMTKTAGVADVLRASLAAFAKKKMIDIAFVYGSVATGKQRPGSDIDLMIIGRVKLKELVPVLRRAQDQLGREINATVYPPDEFTKRLATRDHFLTRVAETPRLMLIGTEDELEDMAG